MKFLNWNTEWAKPGSRRGQRVADRIADHQPDMACLTEAYPEILPDHGHTITSSDKSGYENKGGRRKVALWSREPWSDEWQAEESQLPGGRFISGVTSGYRVVGLCIPWSMAHVSTGRRDRKPWEDHLSYLEALTPILAQFRAEPEPLLVAGDWNQRIPRTSQPEDAFAKLMDAVSGLRVVTSGISVEIGENLIDHLAITPALETSPLRVLPARDETGKPLSDHIGYSLEISGLGV